MDTLTTASTSRLILALRFLREIPLVWFAAGSVLAEICLSVFSGRSLTHRDRLLRSVAFGVGLFVLCMYVILAVVSLHCFMLYLDEANILSIAAAGVHGLPTYDPPRSLNTSYSLMYGPITFLVYRLALIVGGIHHFWIVRGFIVSANLAACAPLFALLVRSVSVRAAVPLLALPISVLLQHPQVSLGLRPDARVFLFSALAIYFSLLETERVSAVLVGVTGGLVVGFKIIAGSAILFPPFFSTESSAHARSPCLLWSPSLSASFRSLFPASLHTIKSRGCFLLVPRA